MNRGGTANRRDVSPGLPSVGSWAPQGHAHWPGVSPCDPASWGVPWAGALRSLAHREGFLSLVGCACRTLLVWPGAWEGGWEPPVPR